MRYKRQIKQSGLHATVDLWLEKRDRRVNLQQHGKFDAAVAR